MKNETQPTDTQLEEYEASIIDRDVICGRCGGRGYDGCANVCNDCEGRGWKRVYVPIKNQGASNGQG